MNQLRRMRRNLANVVSGEALLRVANAGVAVVIARLYGARALGGYAAIIAAATLAERLADNGLELTAIADVSRCPESLNETATAIYLDKTALSVVAGGLLALAAWTLGLSRHLWPIALVLAVRTFLYSYSRSNAGLLKALDKTKHILRIQGFHFFLLVLCVFAVYLRKQDLLVLVLCLLGAQTAEFVLGLGVLLRLGFRPSVIPFSACWSMIRRSAPVGLTYTLSTLMLRGDVVVLSLIASREEVGTFAAANTALVFAYVTAWLFSGVLLSDLGGLSHNRQALDSHFRKCLQAVLIYIVPAAILSALFSRPAILFVFGKQFESAVVPGALMMVALPFVFLNAAFLSRAVLRHATHMSLGIYGFAAVLSLLLNYLLGRWNGAVGVAGSIVIREAVMTGLFVRFWNLGERKAEKEIVELQSA